MRQTITLACAETGERLYLTVKTTKYTRKITAEKIFTKITAPRTFSLKSNNRRKT